MTNDLVRFTNCLLAREDGSLVRQDLWFDQAKGIIVDAQATFFQKKQRPDTTIDLGGNILSPGFLDIQINGAYGFDFSEFNGDEQGYRQNLEMVARRIVQTGVTALVPTIITQDQSLYPTLLRLLRPLSPPNSATLLGWHAEGPFIDFAKRGAHAPSFLLKAPNGFSTFSDTYGEENLADQEDWLLASGFPPGVSSFGVRIITAAPEVDGVMSSIKTLTDRGVVFSIGHSIATSNSATEAVRSGAKLITHLFNAMPQLHHRDPAIIGLLGASPHLYSSYATWVPVTGSLADHPASSPFSRLIDSGHNHHGAKSEAFDDVTTPPLTPRLEAQHDLHGSITPNKRDQYHTVKFERPFYELIVDGIHSHPNSVRLAYTSHPDGCILITDAMRILDPDLQDGIHEWRDGKRFVKEGDKLYLEGTDTLAGSVVTMDKCVRNFSHFTGCGLGHAIRCATYNPARCLGIEHRKGTLRSNADADFVVLNHTGKVLSTWVKGSKVWECS
ncbi:Metallo-dependent hydrolase [Flagelloscypha sp. PMI_526]|nr:Metallo-dependent hydrolase [Flagelloscypha sp. PMI_526]